MSEDKKKAIKSLRETISKMVPAVFTALVATGIGFIALYSSPVPMIQDFGKMLTIGLVISFIFGIFLLIPILFIRDHFFLQARKGKQEQPKAETPTKTDKFIEHLTQKVLHFRWLIIVIAATTALLGIWVDVDAEAETDVETFMPQDTQALKDIHKLRDIIGTTDQVAILYEGKDILSEPTMSWVNQLTDSIKNEFPHIVVETKAVTTILKRMNDGQLSNDEPFEKQITAIPEMQLKLFLNESQTKGMITVGIQHLKAEDLKQFINELDLHLNKNSISGVETAITGKAVLDVEMVHGLTTGRYKMTLLGMGLVFLSLLLIYRHPLKAFIPLLPIIFIVGWSGLIMYLLGIRYTPLTATLGALIIGIGTEFTVLMMERFYEEKTKGAENKEALVTANKRIGRAIFASALTTLGGFSALLASDFVILNNFGTMTIINISLALFSTFIVMPPILLFFDPFIKVKKMG